MYCLNPRERTAVKGQQDFHPGWKDFILRKTVVLWRISKLVIVVSNHNTIDMTQILQCYGYKVRFTLLLAASPVWLIYYILGILSILQAAPPPPQKKEQFWERIARI